MNEKLIKYLEKDIKSQEQVVTEIKELYNTFEPIIHTPEQLKNLSLDKNVSRINKEYLDELKDYQYLFTLKYVKIDENQKDSLKNLINKIIQDLKIDKEQEKYTTLVNLKNKVANIEKEDYFLADEILEIKGYIEENYKTEKEINESLYDLVTNSLKNIISK